MAALPSDNAIRAEINRDWIIRYTFHGETETHLTGAGQYHKLVGAKTAEKHFAKVLEYERSKYIFKIRNTLKIEFSQK